MQSKCVHSDLSHCLCPWEIPEGQGLVLLLFPCQQVPRVVVILPCSNAEGQDSL